MKTCAVSKTRRRSKMSAMALAANEKITIANVVQLTPLALFYQIWNNVFMDSSDCRNHLEALGISQVEFARLIDVTPRAVALWIGGDRSVPGPATAYLRLLRSLPENLRQIEIGRLRARRNIMKNGMYGIEFKSGTIGGHGILTFEDGLVYGVDVAGVRYDGDYTIIEATGLAAVRLKVTYPPGVVSIFGLSNPYEWSIDVLASLDPSKDFGDAVVKANVGPPISATYRYMRPLPLAA